MQKACTQCHVIKPLEEFALAKRRTDGRSSECKQCRKAWAAEYYSKNNKRKEGHESRKARMGVPANPYRAALDYAIANKLPTFAGAPCKKCGNTTRDRWSCNCTKCSLNWTNKRNADKRAQV